MASKKITAMPDWAGNQISTDLVTGVDLSEPVATQNVKSTLNDLFSIITKNITDGAVRWQGFAAPAVSAAGAGSLYFASASNTFKGSRNASAYYDLLFGAGAVTQNAVWSTDADRLQGYASWTYTDASKTARLFDTTFLPTLQVDKNSATVPTMIRLWGGAADAQIYNFSASAADPARLDFYRGGSGPAMPGSGYDVAQIFMAPANSTSSTPTTVGGARILVTTTQAATVGVGGGVGLVIETAGNNETSATRRFVINQHGAVVVGANGQGITSTYGGTATGVVLGQLTTYGADAAIQAGNPFTGNDNITFIIQANAGQTKAIFQLQTSAGAYLYSVGSSGSHTYIGIGGGVAVSPANQGRIYYDSALQKFQVSQNGAAYVDMVTGPAGATAGAIQYNNGSGAFDADSGFIWNSPSQILQIGVASTTAGRILLRNASNANTLILQPGATAANITFTLPTTDGSGVLSWAAASGNNPGGSGAEIQYRGGASTFSAVTGSSVSGGQITVTDKATIALDDAVTNTYSTLLDLQHSSTGTPAASFAGAIRFGLESTTTVNQDAALITVSWLTATDATRTSSLNVYTVTSGGALAEQLRIRDGSVTLKASLASVVEDYTWARNSGLGLTQWITGSGGYTWNNTGNSQVLGHFTGSGDWKLQSDQQYTFTNSTTNAYAGTADTGIARAAAGVARVSDASTGAGQFIVGSSSASTTAAQAYVVSASAARVAFRVDSLTNSTVALNQFYLNADDTSTVALHSVFSVDSNGTAANGFGGQLLYQLESSTTNQQDAAAINWSWTDATHASRTAKFQFQLVGAAAALATVAEFDMDTTAGNTRFLIYDVDNATLERVSVGAADSGGSGFKVLRIAN